jgi:hypothetical protein
VESDLQVPVSGNIDGEQRHDQPKQQGVTMLLNSEQLAAIEQQLSERGGALDKTLSDLESKITDERAKLDAEKSTHLGSASTEHRNAISATFDKTSRKKLRDLRHKLDEDSRDDRAAIMQVLDDYDQSIEDTLNLHASPVQVLSRSGLGEAERSALLDQLKDAGPAELRSAADLAAATNDRVMGGVVLTVADRDRKKHNQFDRAQFAERMVGGETKELRHRLESAKVQIRAMRDANTAFVRGGENPTSKISRGLAQQRLQPKNDQDAIGRAMRGQR